MQSTEIRIETPDGTSYSQPTGIFIGNTFSLSQEGGTFESVNPYTQKTICSVSQGGAQDIDNAVKAASQASRAWRNTPAHQRGLLLSRLGDLVERDADILARIEVGLDRSLHGREFLGELT